MATSVAALPMDDDPQKQRQHVLHSLRSKGLVIPDEPGAAIDQNQFGGDGAGPGRGGKGELLSPVTRIIPRGRPAPSTVSHENLNHKLGLIPTLSAILPLLSPNGKRSSILSPRSDGGKPFAFPLTPTTRLPARALAPDYRRIEDHGVIGNMCTVALVGTDACIDWFCYPCFDSPSVFSSILDHKIGGFYSIRASNSNSQRVDASNFDSRGVCTSQTYLDNTNVLVTRFTSERDDAVAQVQDFMPVPLPSVSVDREKGSGRSWLIRSLEMVRGSMWFEVQCCPAFNYAQDAHEVQTLPHGARFISPKLTLVLTSSRAHYWGPSSAPGGVSLYIQLREGEREVFTLREDDDHYYLSRFQTGALSPTTPICKASAFPSPATHTEGKAGPEAAQSPPEEPLLISPLPRAAVSVAGEAINISLDRVAGDPEQPSSSSSLPGRPDDLTPEHPLPTPSPTLDLPPEMRGEDVSSHLHKSTFDVPFVPVELTDRLYRKTVKFWLRWIGQCTYQGRWRKQVVRSALALKLMTFAPTGALVAAPTCSLPECIGGNRNWDYRYCWLRDSSFMLRALLMLGFKEEAVAFLSWLERRCLAQEMEVERVDRGMQIMYGLRGEKRLDESTLDHFGGYMGSGPVRIGNAAVEQLQMDIYGEMLDMIWYCDQNAEPISASLWAQTRNLVEFVVRHWRAKDNSIWEVRGGMQHFVYSKVMCWTALDRGIKLAEARGFDAPLDRWSAVKKEIYDDIQVNGYNEQKKAFVQSYNSDSLDAACLFLPIVGFMPPTDPRIRGTLDAICRTTDKGGLMSDNMVFRYDVESTDDGFKGTDEGTFSICTFWAVEALAMTGLHNPEYLKRSLQIFNDTIRKGNHVDLFSEEISVKGGALGNFPQGFTHLAIIRAAVYLDHALSCRAALPFELRQDNEVDEREYNHVSASSASITTPIHGDGSKHAHVHGQLVSPNHSLSLNQILARPAYTRHLSHFLTTGEGASQSTTFTMSAPMTMPAANGRQRAQTFNFR